MMGSGTQERLTGEGHGLECVWRMHRRGKVTGHRGRPPGDLGELSRGLTMA